MPRVGLVSLVIAKRRGGKSTKVKSIIKGIDLPKYIFDIRSEYYQGRRIKTDIDSFLDLVRNKKKCVIVFEEATVFFRGRSGEQMLDILTGASHNHNFIVLVFHSFRAVPLDILELVDFIFFSQTKDSETVINRKYRDDDFMLRLYKKSKGMNKFSFFCTAVE